MKNKENKSNSIDNLDIDKLKREKKPTIYIDFFSVIFYLIYIYIYIILCTWREKHKDIWGRINISYYMMVYIYIGVKQM